MRISSVDGGQSLDIDAVVDTGAMFTTLRLPVLRKLDIAPTGRRRFLIADGRRIEMEYGEARAIIDGESVTTIVAFGEDTAPPVLGAYTLEGLAVAVDPSTQRLVPAELIRL